MSSWMSMTPKALRRSRRVRALFWAVEASFSLLNKKPKTVFGLPLQLPRPPVGDLEIASSMRQPHGRPRRIILTPLKQMHPDTIRRQSAPVQNNGLSLCHGISFSEDLLATSQALCSFGAYHAMASPPPSSHQTRGDSSEDYYYLIVAVAAVMVLLLVSNMIAVGCCSSCSILEAIRRFLRSRGLLAGEVDDARILELIPVCKYQKEQAQEHECAVCLSVIADGEEFRQLPRCKHSFHAPCIDMWLYSHSNCPLCRADVLERPPPRCRSASAAGGQVSIQRHPIEPRGIGSLIVALV